MDRKNMLKAGRRSSLNVSNRSLNVSSRSLNATSRTQAVAESANYLLENYGTSLPVTVIELIGSSERKSQCSVNLSSSGWAWFVSGRHLVIWKYSKAGGNAASTPMRKSAAVTSPKSFELTLPPSDLAHKASLVSVFSSDPDATVPSCIAVSPEGTVRYWDSVTHENFFYEINADLQGQECDSLIEAMPLACVVATTTASVLLLTLKCVDGRSAIQCRNFKTSQGLLGSIGRRMSTLIFGSMPVQSPETRLVKLLAMQRDQNTLDVQILCSQSLQYWQVSGDAERLMYQIDIDQWARESLIAHIWSRDSINIRQLRIWILDAQLHKEELVFLIAAVNPNISTQMQYALACVPLSPSSAPTNLSWFCVLKFATCVSSQDEDSPPNCSFILNGSSAYIYSDKWILCVPSNEPLEEPDRLEVRLANERILGAGLFNQRPVFFSTRHGVLVLNPSTGDNQSFFGEESILDHSVLVDHLDTTQNESMTSKLKLAFFNFCRKNVFEAQTLLEDLFSAPSSKNEVDSLMDRMVIELSQKIIDDYPASDPRWTDSVPAGHESTFTTVSLLVLHQLEDKVKAHDLFLTFLRNMSLWNELTAVSERRGSKSTVFTLLEHAEKLRSSLALRALHTPGSTLIDTTIGRVLQERQVDASNDKLTQQDLFYRHVSAVGDFFAAFVDVVCETVGALVDPGDKVKEIVAASNYVIAMANAARDYRTRNMELVDQCEITFEILPWIAVGGTRSVRSSIVRLVELVVEEGVANCDDAGVRNGLWGQASNLCDLLLDSLKMYIDSVENPAAYAQARHDVHSQRSALLAHFLKAREFDRAAILAEKYVDFNALLTVCDQTLNDNRLADYIDKLGDQGFTEFACKWYMQRDQREKLLQLQRPEVSAFLENHGDILWVDQSQRDQFLQAAETLANLATAQKDSFGHKKTLLSLAKLHLITEEKSGGCCHTDLIRQQLDRIESELDLATHQEQLPAAVLEAFGVDANTMRVFTPQELVEMYICDENVLANELDFKKALDLLHYIDDVEERDSLRLSVWARSILRDAWTTLDTDSVLQSITSTVFYKIIDFCLSTGDAEDLTDLLPTVDDILQQPLLSDLCTNDVFKFLLQAVYEHVNALIESN